MFLHIHVLTFENIFQLPLQIPKLIQFRYVSDELRILNDLFFVRINCIYLLNYNPMETIDLKNNLPGDFQSTRLWKLFELNIQVSLILSFVCKWLDIMLQADEIIL